jgi:hypothetical protein
MSFLAAFRHKTALIKNAVRTAWRRQRQGSDVARWSSEGTLSPDWDGRTRLIASLIPAGSSVLEFGAGRLVLRDYLPSGCRYTPSDLVDRGAGTIVCDLNAKVLPDFPRHDVAIFSGVLEYVNDVPRLVRHLSPRVNAFVLSYAVTDTNASLVYRRADGWVNDFSASALVKVFADHGFRCDRTESWRSQQVFRFVH